MSKYFLSMALAALALAACSPKESSMQSPQAAQPGTAGQAANAPSPATAAVASTAPNEPKGPDMKLPMANYTRIDYDDEQAVWLTYLVSAQAKENTGDEDLLNMFSPRYYNEKDAFKKRELAASELPRVKAVFDQYKAQKYYSMEVNRPDAHLAAISPTLYLSSPYDFDAKSFPVSHGSCLKDMTHFNRQQAGIVFELTSPGLCQIKVENLELAKKIEELRVRNRLELHSVVHFYVRQVDGNTAKAVVTRVHYDVYDKSAPIKIGNPLVSVDA